MKIYKCTFCNFSVPSDMETKGKKNAKHIMGEHYEFEHKDSLPDDMNGYRYFYYLLTKKEKGSCVICHEETDFNMNTMKYCRFCNNPECKQKYKEQRDKNMMNKYGKVHLLDDPETQKKMQSGRRIAGTYKWSDESVEFGYLSSYELHFMQFLDNELKWKSSDLMSPSPHTYTYEYQDKKRFYMPDFFIPSLNLEIEIKDDGSAKNINQDSRAKDEIKHELMLGLSNLFNYIKIVNKDYTEFLTLIRKDDETNG